MNNMSTERKLNNQENNAGSVLLLSNSTEEANASRSRTSDFCERNETSVGNKREHNKKRGRKKKGYSMGTYPFLSVALKYLEDQKPFLAESTQKERRCKFKYLNRELVKLWKAGKISTANPKKMTEKDIGAILLWMQERNLDVRTQRKYLGFLTMVLRWCSNPVIDKMRTRGLQFPKEIPKEIKTLSEEEIQCIQKATEQMSGWHGEILRFIVPMYAYTGLRPKELRLAQIEDLDTTNWTFWVRHPKGESRYGEQRTVPIPPLIRSYVQKYLTARAEELGKRKIDYCEQLIPSLHGNKPSYFSDVLFRLLKDKLEKEAKIHFSLKDFRSSYAQILKDRGVNIEVVSKALGHSSTETTERYYARIRDSSTFESINEAFEKPIGLNPKKAQMGLEKWVSGYA